MLSSADFEKALSVRPCARSAHFAVHYVPPAPLEKKVRAGEKQNLSTGAAPIQGEAVDESENSRSILVLDRRAAELGMVVPKRNARRSVTRNLVKRHIRAAFGEECRHARLASGAWVVRLRSPLEKKLFVSANSDLLAEAVRVELADLLQRVPGRKFVDSPVAPCAS
jgi:ribonuclease P protein component